MTRGIALLCASLLLATTHSVAQDARAPRATGAYLLHGVILDADARVPIRRARVTASISGSTSTATPLTVVSDAEGRFLLANVPAGQYTISASKPGYLNSSYGQVRYGGPSLPIAVPSDEASQPLTVTMSRGGVIAGRVLDSSGEPAIRAQVRALQYRYEPGGRRLAWIGVTGSGAMTDDLGAFRLYALPPGRYYVSAGAGPFSGSFPSVPGAEVTLPAITYFPNTIDAATAQPLVVTAEKEVAPITITLGAARAVRVRGRVMKTNGEPLEGFVDLSLRTGVGVLPGGFAAIRADGTFQVERVLPGEYQLVARTPPRDPRSGARSDDDVGYAMVTVGNEDVDSVLIVAGKAGIARGRVIADQIRNAATSAATVTRQLLMFSRKGVTSPQPINVNRAVSYVEKMIARLIGEDIRVFSNLNPGVGTVLVDPAHLEQALINLAVNARDAMPQGGVLIFETAPADNANAVQISVRDSGHGMDETTQQRACEPFFTTKASGKGTGLGLSMVYGFVQQAGGTVNINSTLGRGTTVTLVFPCATASMATSAEVASVGLSGNERLLVVEDQDSVRSLISGVLEKRGFTVFQATDARDARRVLAAEPAIDLVITDVVMPGESGLELAEWLRHAYPKARVTFMSGYSDHPAMATVPRENLLPKPFTPSGLLTHIRSVLNNDARAEARGLMSVRDTA